MYKVERLGDISVRLILLVMKFVFAGTAVTKTKST